MVFGQSDAALRSLSLEGNNTYLLWEIGKALDFILEIGSKSTANADLVRKRELYAELGVGEYWRYDATGGEFELISEVVEIEKAQVTERAYPPGITNRR